MVRRQCVRMCVCAYERERVWEDCREGSVDLEICIEDIPVMARAVMYIK